MDPATLTVGGTRLRVEPWTSAPTMAGHNAVHPDGCMDVVWFEGRLAVAGPATRRLDVDLVPGTRSAGLRFPGGALPTLLGVPAHVLRDQVVPLDEFWAGSQDRWGGAVGATDDPVAALADLVRTRAAGPPQHSALLRRIEDLAGRGSTVAAIASDTGYSERQLRRLCLDAFGYGPRTLGRILRFVRASRDLRAGGRALDVAAATGYADQPHMVREFRALTGTTPASFAPATGPAGRRYARGANRSMPRPSGSSTTA